MDSVTLKLSNGRKMLTWNRSEPFGFDEDLDTSDLFYFVFRISTKTDWLFNDA